MSTISVQVILVIALAVKCQSSTLHRKNNDNDGISSPLFPEAKTMLGQLSAHGDEMDAWNQQMNSDGTKSKKTSQAHPSHKTVAKSVQQPVQPPVPPTVQPAVQQSVPDKPVLSIDQPLVNYFDATCGAGWIGIRGTDKCIKVLNKRLTFNKADQECYELDPCATLLTIHSAQENQVLTEILAQNSGQPLASGVWIGLVGKKERVLSWLGHNEPVFSWMDNSTLTYTNWKPFSALHGEGQCVALSLTNNADKNGKWCQQDCLLEREVVCQKIVYRGLYSKPCPVKVFDNTTAADAIVDNHGQWCAV